MRVRMIQPRFVMPIMAGTKVTTIRPKPWTVGETYDIRTWTGEPRRSPQEHVAFRMVRSVQPVTVTVERVVVRLGNAQFWFEIPLTLNFFARCDGFLDWADMRGWFIENHGAEMRRDGFEGSLMTFEDGRVA